MITDTLASSFENNARSDPHTNEGAKQVRSIESDQIESVESKDRRPMVIRVGARVERELDGLWFPGTVTDAEPNSDCYEIEYDEGLNRESEVSASELRLFDPSRIGEPLMEVLAVTAQQRVILQKDSLLMQTPDYDSKKAPTIVLHHQGETNAATGYIINGLENNVATGNGLRGIRWLRGNSF